jgi:hypothetical protein
MRILRLVSRRLTEVTLLALLLLLGSVANGDAAEQLQQGEDVIVLDVENMT